jgi:hypothetical protein
MNKEQFARMLAIAQRIVDLCQTEYGVVLLARAVCIRLPDIVVADKYSNCPYKSPRRAFLTAFALLNTCNSRQMEELSDFLSELAKYQAPPGPSPSEAEPSEAEFPDVPDQSSEGVGSN